MFSRYYFDKVIEGTVKEPGADKPKTNEEVYFDSMGFQNASPMSTAYGDEEWKHYRKTLREEQIKSSLFNKDRRVSKKTSAEGKKNVKPPKKGAKPPTPREMTLEELKDVSEHLWEKVNPGFCHFEPPSTTYGTDFEFDITKQTAVDKTFFMKRDAHTEYCEAAAKFERTKKAVMGGGD
eukprot:GFYU01007786.1.p1 GENE.GFYU01007786.1~~GFYU01007786.1.p1  ORF type:complete len:179 (-),score=76.29 GFYU01007786.1:317-853(-)